MLIVWMVLFMSVTMKCVWSKPADSSLCITGTESGFGGSFDVSNIGCQISYVFTVGRYVRVWGLKRPQKTSNVSIF